MTSAKITETPKKPVESRAASENTRNSKTEAHKGEKSEKSFDAELAEVDNAVDAEESVALEGDVVASTELKSPAINLNDLMSEGLEAQEPTPKVLDPKLIKQVNEAILPEGAEQVEATPMQLKDLLMQQKPVVAQGAGRSPAIDFAPAEVDPKLMNFEDFVAQKNAVKGKAVAPNAYGMPAKTTMNVEALMGDKAVMAMETRPELMLNTEAGTGTAAQPQLAQAAWSMEAPTELNRAEATQTQKVFNLNNLTNTQDTDGVMSQISDYIVQAKAAKEPTVNMKVQHQDLGMLDITVNRVQNDVVSIAIGTQDNASKLFLGQHRDSLMSHLSQAGVNVSDLKLEQSSASKNNNSFDQNQQQASNGQDRQFGSEQNQRRHDQERREELWDLVREKEVA
jgi:hypothetical protein